LVANLTTNFIGADDIAEAYSLPQIL